MFRCPPLVLEGLLLLDALSLSFVTILDVIEVAILIPTDWAREFKHWPLCRIGNSTSPLERRAEMDHFRHGRDKPGVPRLFLLSTPRAEPTNGLAGARSGRRSPCLASGWSDKIMRRKRSANSRRSSSPKGNPSGRSVAVPRLLLELQDEHIEVVLTAGKRTVISDAELHMLLDRREEDLKGRCAGWKSGAAGKDSKGDGINARAGTARAGGGDADGGLFEVYKGPSDEDNDALAHMLGEDLAA
ncbi:hypothetical protein BJV74DRAFT_796421 [Russula compacta]|nr:hypothetical protein BJV74DRAFT_796421 [Russula compacta]